MANDENKFLPIFQILHINNVWFLLQLALALVTSIEMKFAPVWPDRKLGNHNTVHQGRGGGREVGSETVFEAAAHPLRNATQPQELWVSQWLFWVWYCPKILRALCQLNSWNNAAICDRLIPRCHDGLATAGLLQQARQARFGPWGRILDLAWLKLAVVALYCHYVGCIIWTVSSSWYLFVRPS